jgi:hypothetical protein
MLRKPIIAAILVLVLASLACGININLPVQDIKTGPEVTKEISAPLLDDPQAVANVTLSFGAGNLTVGGGAEDVLVSGTATFNVQDFEPKVTTEGKNVRIEQGDLNLQGIPNFQEDIVNEWDLQLNTTPMDLHIGAGAYTGKYELGGLSLQNLTVSDGAADVKMSFSEPNLDEMTLFEYNTGASNVTISNLANANVNTIIFRGGAGSYTLDFGGELKRDMLVSVESGISNITIIIPDGVSAEVTFEGGLSNVSTDKEWDKSENIYTLAGEGPLIKITIKMGAGNLNLQVEK